MDSAARDEVSRLLTESTSGRLPSAGRLLELLQDELHGQARRWMAKQPSGHTLQATAVVREAFQLMGAESVGVHSRSHLLALSARCMRQVLARHARDRSARRRGGAWGRVSSYEDSEGTDECEVHVQRLHAALEKLSERDPEQARIVEIRFFAGMTMAEVAGELSVSVSTVEREWRVARLDAG